jgi:hypothetical protein
VVNATPANALNALYALWGKQDGSVKASLQAVIDQLLGGRETAEALMGWGRQWDAECFLNRHQR